jgi:hypothetical protein
VLKTASLARFPMQCGAARQLRRLWTRGAVAGYTAELLMNRKAGVGVIVLSNGAANPTSIAPRALDILSK